VTLPPPSVVEDGWNEIAFHNRNGNLTIDSVQ